MRRRRQGKEEEGILVQMAIGNGRDHNRKKGKQKEQKINERRGTR